MENWGLSLERECKAALHLHFIHLADGFIQREAHVVHVVMAVGQRGPEEGLLTVNSNCVKK